MFIVFDIFNEIFSEIYPYLLAVGIFLLLFVILRVVYRNVPNIINVLNRIAKNLIIFGLFLLSLTIIFIIFIGNNVLIFNSLSISFGFVSVGLALLAYKKSEISNRKMTQVANEKILDIERTFEDRRQDFLQKLKFLENKSNFLDNMLIDRDLKEERVGDLRIFLDDFDQIVKFNLLKIENDIKRADILAECTEDMYQNRILISTTNFLFDLLTYTNFLLNLKNYISLDCKVLFEKVDNVHIINDLIENHNFLGLTEDDSSNYLTIYNELSRIWEKNPSDE